MKKFLKKGMVVVSIYFVAILCTFLVTNRVAELDSNKNPNNTKALVINFSK